MNLKPLSQNSIWDSVPGWVAKFSAFSVPTILLERMAWSCDASAARWIWCTIAEPPTGFQRFETTSTYSPPPKQVRFHVELLRDNPFPKGVLGSKAIGEPPFMHLDIADSQTTFQVEGFRFGHFQVEFWQRCQIEPQVSSFFHWVLFKIAQFAACTYSVICSMRSRLFRTFWEIRTCQLFWLGMLATWPPRVLFSARRTHCSFHRIHSMHEFCKVWVLQVIYTTWEPSGCYQDIVYCTIVVLLCILMTTCSLPNSRILSFKNTVLFS